jgi:hypothetical protein
VEEADEEMHEEGELTNDKLMRLRRENQVKDIIQKESLDLLALKRAVMLLFTLVDRFSSFL